VRTFKIAEDENPGPQDRGYIDFNYFNNVNRKVNEVLDSALHNFHVFRETFGVEKTFLDGDASLGLRMPVNSVLAESNTAGVDGVHDTDFGDLTVISKYAFWRGCGGNLLSAGLAVTVPTGPTEFAHSAAFFPVHTTVLTPYLGYRFRFDRWYVQGFSSIDVPAEEKDVTILHNDVQLGYELYRCRDADAWLTGVVPHFEVHVNDPLNHRGTSDATDPVGTADWVDLTTGVTLELRRTATLAIGFVTPVTGPKPYDFEVLVQLDVRFGRTAAQAQQGGNVLGD
jgi:hypothetical protein